MARALLAQLYKGFTEIQSLFTQPLCYIEIKHKMMPRHRGVLFMERSQSQMTALLQPTAVAEKSQTGHRWAELRSNEKRSEWKMWALSLWTLDCSFRPSFLITRHLPLLCSLSVTHLSLIIEWALTLLWTCLCMWSTSVCFWSARQKRVFRCLQVSILTPLTGSAVWFFSNYIFNLKFTWRDLFRKYIPQKCFFFCGVSNIFWHHPLL